MVYIAKMLHFVIVETHMHTQMWYSPTGEYQFLS